MAGLRAKSLEKKLKKECGERLAAALQKGNGVHRISDGLYLSVKGDARSWLRRWFGGEYKVSKDGKRYAVGRSRGLGGYPKVSLADALQAVKAEPPAPTAIGKTFGQVADEYIAAHFPDQTSHADQVARSLRTYGAALSKIPVDQIDIEVLETVLRPLYVKTPETASRLRAQIEAVLGLATVKRYRSGDNPARLRGNLEFLLPKRTAPVAHHLALDYHALPGFMASLREYAGNSARCLQFLILTAARTSEATGATWAEIDLEGRLWTIPGERMKAGKEHRVPLSDAALAILGSRGEGPVFTGYGGRQLDNSGLKKLIWRTGRKDLTVHGFRSTFRDWAGNETHYPREVAEAALAHAVGNAVERAYRRSDALAKRRQLMADWSDFCGAAV